MKPKIILENVSINGARVGIKSDMPVDIQASGVTFSNVEKPFDLATGSTGHIENNIVQRDPKHPIDQEVIRSSSIGWERPNGPPLPSYCPACKNIFPSKNYVFAGPFFYCWGNKEQCVVCGCPDAELSQGTFDLSGTTAAILRGPDITRDMIARLAALGTDASHGKLTAAELEQAAADIHPAFGPLIRDWRRHSANAIVYFFAIVGAVDSTWSLVERLSNSLIVERILDTAFSINTAPQDLRSSESPEEGLVQLPSEGPIPATRPWYSTGRATHKSK